MRGQYKRDGKSLLTEVEKTVNHEQEHKTCLTCERLQHRCKGARGCVKGHDPMPVICGEKICEDWEAICYES